MKLGWTELVAGVGLTAVGCAVLPSAAAAAGASALLITISGELAKAVGGSLACGGFEPLKADLLQRLGRPRLKIDENHHIIAQLRRSYLEALLVLHNKFKGRATPSEAVFLGKLKTFIDEAAKSAKRPQALGVSEDEKAVLSQLPGLFEAAMAARGTPTIERIREQAEAEEHLLFDAALDELREAIGATEVPHSFRNLFCAREGGFVELYVRSAASAIKANPDFRTIWTAEQIARISIYIEIVFSQLQKLEALVLEIRDLLVRSNDQRVAESAEVRQ